MKILLLAPHPFFSERGTPIAVRLAVEALCAMGHQVDLLTYHEGEDIEVAGMRLLRISAPPGVRNVPIGFSVKKLVCDLWLAIAAFRLMFRNRYDVVHGVEESVFIALAARPFGKFRVVYDMDSLMADQIAEKWPKAGPVIPMLRWIERQAMSRADLVLPVCEAIAESARAATNPARVHLLPDVASRRRISWRMRRICARIASCPARSPSMWATLRAIKAWAWRWKRWRPCPKPSAATLS